jgi:DNA-binding XRE family transcriptional regulator
LALRTISNLDEVIKKYQKEVSIKEEKDITIQEIMEAIGDYADISWTTIKQFKNKDMQPSLAVAIRIAEFLKTSVEELWTVEYEYSMIDEEKKPKKVKEIKVKPKCKDENCERESIARGYCNKHYQQFRNYNKDLFDSEKPHTCTHEDCTEPYYAKGLCAFHYNRDYRSNKEEGRGFNNE